MTQSLHQSVLLQAATAALAVQPAGHYLDATFGRGGHAREILKNLSEHGCLDVIDRDPEALHVAHKLAEDDSRVRVFAGDFESIMCEQVNSNEYDEIGRASGRGGGWARVVGEVGGERSCSSSRQ